MDKPVRSYQHEVKCIVEAFKATWNDLKPYEVRKDDRGYQPGDSIWLREWTGASYTGRWMNVVVTYKTAGGTFGLPLDLCVMACRVVERSND